MPTPLGHALGGAICALAMAGTPAAAPDATVLGGLRRALASSAVLIAAAAACLPDVDFLWGRHNMETHSLGAAVAAGLVTLAITGGRRPRLAAIVTAAWASHVLFDWLGSDDTPPLGVMALWPMSSSFYFADAFVFEAISRRYWLPGFWAHNLWALVTETAILAPLVITLAVFRERVAAAARRR